MEQPETGVFPSRELCRPEHWYACADRDDGVTHIFEPYIDVFYRCNIWHVRGRDRSLLATLPERTFFHRYADVFGAG